ncbi:hypothetical protein ACFL6S_17420 [Candidatus Poribacteria bacterium]
MIKQVITRVYKTINTSCKTVMGHILCTYNLEVAEHDATDFIFCIAIDTHVAE